MTRPVFCKINNNVYISSGIFLFNAYCCCLLLVSGICNITITTDILLYSLLDKVKILKRKNSTTHNASAKHINSKRKKAKHISGFIVPEPDRLSTNSSSTIGR